MESRWTMLGVLVGMAAIVVGLWQHFDNREYVDQNATPRIEFLSNRDQGGYQFITLKNTSPTTFANITAVSYKITDHDSLARIANIHPAPPTVKLRRGEKPPPCPCGPPADDVFFRTGCWCGEAYVYTAKVSLHLPRAGQGSDLKLAIIDRSLTGQMIGELRITYDGDKATGAPYVLRNVSVPVRRSE